MRYKKEKRKIEYLVNKIKIFSNFSLLLIFLISNACGTKPKTSILLRDSSTPPQVVQEIFAKEGKSDYILLNDEGYSIRLIYLCENRIHNFVEEPEKNLVLVSLQSILDTPVERKLRDDDRRRIWACIERKVREEQYRIEEFKRKITEERIQIEKEVNKASAEKERILAEITKKKQLEAERQRRLEEERRVIEEERLRKMEEEQRKKAEEDRKIRLYKAGEKDESPPPAPIKITESGSFLIMRETDIFEEPKEKSKIHQATAQKYDVFEVINSAEDLEGIKWYQVILGERIIAEKGKKLGWSPEEKSFWVRNKLLVWVYPGDLSRISTAKPIKLNVEDVQFTGKKASTSQRPAIYEVAYEENTSATEKIIGWVNEKSGIRRANKNKEEMRNLLKDLSRTLWPIRIQTDILKGYIRIGFTPEQVVLSWGQPDHVNKTRTLVGIHEQWVYGETPFPNAYVYFENGLVKSWEFLKGKEN
jgi:hypothetical protein